MRTLLRALLLLLALGVMAGSNRRLLDREPRPEHAREAERNRGDNGAHDARAGDAARHARARRIRSSRRPRCSKSARALRRPLRLVPRNDGSGDTSIGRSLYPPAPDMRAARTQALSDGELFAIIENGIRLTGMPAWGTGTPEGERDSWALVHFIRRMPSLTPDGDRADGDAESEEPGGVSRGGRDPPIPRRREAKPPAAAPKPHKHDHR